MSEFDEIGKSFFRAGAEFVKEERAGDPPAVRQFIMLTEKYGLEKLSQWSDEMIQECSQALIASFQQAHGHDPIGGLMPYARIPSQIEFQLKAIRGAARIKIEHDSMPPAACIKEAIRSLAQL